MDPKQTDARRQSHLDRYFAWSQSLLAEFYEIPFVREIRLSAPAIEIVNSGEFWGRWIPHGRTIQLQEALFLNYPWRFALWVFKHEVAHLITDEVFASPGRPHGATFRHVCKRLALPEAFWGPTTRQTDLEQLLRAAERESEPTLRKAHKLLAVAESTNEFEASLAMQRVQELFERHNWQHRHVQTEGPKITYIDIALGKRITLQQRLASDILNTHYFVSSVFSFLPGPLGQKSQRALQVIGTQTNLDLAEYVFQFLDQSVKSLWTDHRKHTGAAANLRNSYQVGVLEGFRQKLDDARKVRRKEGAPGALISAKTDPGIQEFSKNLYGSLQTLGQSRVRIHAQARSAGVEQGKALVLRKAVKTRTGGTTGYLT